MRLHRLEVTAFGPFAGTETVDFDELNDAGLFLLTGATGAGKSSLLDAVCFALYGTVPGVRGVKTLASQHAAAGTRPEVVLDLTIRARRFVLRRSPEWSRPKRRGLGTTEEKASASLLETTGGTERLLSSRAAEVGLLVGDLMGMTAGQFMQVALLPQGEFQTFLRASSQERHDVLQQLFHTDRFSRIEHWVEDRSRLLRVAAAAGEDEVRRGLHVLADRSGQPLPADAVEDLAAAAAAGSVLRWAETLLDDAGAAAAVAADEHRTTAAAVEVARRTHETEVRLVDQMRRVGSARRVLSELEESAERADLDRDRLAAHERAQQCGPLLDLLEQATSAQTSAGRRLDRARSALAGASPDSGVASRDQHAAAALDAAAEGLRGTAARLQALLPHEREVLTLRRERRESQTRLAALRSRLEEERSRLARLPAEVAELEKAHAAAVEGAARVKVLTVDLRTAREREAAAVELSTLAATVGLLEDRHRDVRDRAQDARERVLTLTAARLAGMAAELAADLADGVPCQVCGSADHPRPAAPAADAVTAADQERAEQERRDSADELETVADALRGLRHRCALLEQAAAGLTPAQAAVAVRSVEGALATARADAVRRDALASDLSHRRAEESALGVRHTATSSSVAALQEALNQTERRLGDLLTELAEALAEVGASVPDGPDGPDAPDGPERCGEAVAAALESVRHRAGLVTDTAAALRETTDAGQRVADLRQRALDAAVAGGFAALEDVGAALVEESERDRIRDSLARRGHAAALASAVLEEAELAGIATSAPEPDLTATTAALSEAEAHAEAAARRVAVHEDRCAVLRTHLLTLRSSLAGWAPARDEALRAESMSLLVRGMGHDNQLQMRLSAYVLATRLDQVVAAANERLAQMRDQRYLLQRTARVDRRGSRAGLGLEVVDQWTGDVRGPATLSGGETFVVSLSLALGLADVVTHEAGGTEIETLFVDEGFGSLDADTLDDVMDRLDGLRSGGRTVGVVSHVSELRSRIATQVHVAKGRSGSTVSVRTLTG